MAVTWESIRDHHVRGTTEIGFVWLRLDKAGLVTGAYTMFGRTKKLVPEPEEQWDLETGKLAVAIELDAELTFRQKIGIM